MGTVIVSANHRKLMAPVTPVTQNVWGHANTVSWHGEQYFVLPHTPPYTLALQHLGYKAPGPITCHYDWPGSQPPFDAQKRTADMLSLNRRAYVLSDIGVGKTRSALFAADYLMQEGVIRKCLVAAPLSTVSSVWENEIFSVMPHREAVSLHHYKKAGRVKQLNQDVDFYIINHHGVGVLQEELLRRDDIDCILIDELATYRNPTTNLWKAMNAVVQGRKYVWGMTGFPTPNGPEDAYGQVKLITPERVPKSARAWRSMTMNKVSQFIFIPKKDANDTVHKAFHPSVRFTRDECLDLPPKMVSTLDVSMATRQARIYEELTKRYKAKLVEGEVTAANEGVLVNKLLQVSCGFVYTNTKGSVDLKNQDRLDVLKSVIQAARNKVIVFAPFVFAVEMLSAEVQKYARVGVVHGSIPKKERDDIFRQFQNGRDMKVLVAHPGCMAHGLTLTSSNVIVWYSPIQSPEIYEQGNGRITRAGQSSKQYIVHLCGSPAERRVFARLKRKQRMQGLLLDMFNGVAIDA